ncbi:hypothetical protein [Halomonas chromatireducens]|uniref:Uncharacterized protein n=1 Tax=Halomonas chromatireducens TaxID=507626 RepID=A0A109UMH8_9GAMM|nr:hypothetical protein [Halomonas chromatireducens]AMD01781.1 hypothetical protein LOKO_02728 [Halomonas chromatireducens]
MNAKDKELSRLEALIAQYDQHQALRGELIFGAINDDGRLDVATPFFEDADYEALKANGLRDALIGLLDDMMVERSAYGAEQAHDGILRLGSGKVVLEWLPEGASRDAADARRDDWDLIPWLIERLGLVQHEAIERKKAQAAKKHKDDTSQWKREIWLSPDKNRAIKTALTEEGQRLGFQVLPAGSRGEWLYDLVWRRLDANRNLVGMPLAVEIEMSDNRLWGIRYDFNKLLQAQADHKLMVFQVQTQEEVEAVFERLKESIDVYPHGSPCRYLLCGWSTQQNAFHFEESRAQSALT